MNYPLYDVRYSFRPSVRRVSYKFHGGGMLGRWAHQVVYKATDLLALTIFQARDTTGRHHASTTNYGGQGSLSSLVAIDLLISHPDDLIRAVFTSRTSPNPPKPCGRNIESISLAL